MSTCRGCGTPNRSGRALCIACGERLVSSDPPSEGAGPHSGSLVEAPNEAAPPEHEQASVERTAAFDRAGFRPPTLLGVGTSEELDATEEKPPAPEGAPTDPGSRRVATTIPPSVASPSTVAPTAALPAVDLPVTGPMAEEEAPAASPASVVGSPPPPRQSRRRWVLLAGGLSLALIAAAAGAAAFLQHRTGPSSTPPNVRARVALDGIGEMPPFATLHVVAPPTAQVIVTGPSLAPAGASPESGARLGPWRIDLSGDARGEEPAAQVLERHLELDVRLADGTSHRSTVSFQAPVTPLVLTGPGPRWVTQPGTLVISGKTQAGALVQAGASRTRADPHGQFHLPVRRPSPDTLTVSAHADGFVIRHVPLRIATQAELPASVPFDALESRLGQRVRVDGKVLEIRERPAGTTLLLEVTQGCPADAGACRVSTLQPLEPESPGALTYTPGEKLTVVGDVTLTGSLPHLRAEWIQPL